MAIKLPDGRTSLKTVLVDRSSGREIVLFEREGSRCQFAVDYPYNTYIIALRVDWGDLEKGDPVLDADIFLNAGGSRGKRIANAEWHHTRLTPTSSGDLRIYAFRFKGLTLELIARKSLALTVGVSACIVNQGTEPK